MSSDPSPSTPPEPAVTPEQVVAQLHDRPGTVWLDGGDEGPWSVVVWAPDDVLDRPEDWPVAARALAAAGARTPTGDPTLPFTSGLVGYVGYGAGPAVAPVSARTGAWEPDLWLGRYEGALLFHHPSGTWTATGSARRQRDAHALLDQARTAGPLPPPSAPRAPRSVDTVDRDAYLAALDRALAWIAEGDCYQLNLSRPVFVEGVGSAWEAWRRIRAASRPTRGAWLSLPGGLRILSNSPERLLDWRGDEATTVPIKGTRPRGRDSAEDHRLHAELEHSAKEQAELTMIVDLCRNDLGRVALPGGVQAAPRRVVRHANVLHAEQTVHARIRPEHDAWDALAALFPPGSVTGAPKVRATQRIAQLEPHPRGVYCGAVGHVSDHGRASFNVAIRTAVVRGDRARWHVGGGIVADSDPAAEWEETVAKGTVLAKALTGTERL